MNNEEILHKVVSNLKESYCYLKPVDSEKIGVFAKRDIPKDTILVFPKSNLVSIPTNSDTKNKLLSILGSDFINWIYEFWKPTDSEKIYIPTNGLHVISLYNYLEHSNKPNIFRSDENFITLRDIKKEEKILINYRQLNVLPAFIPTRKQLRNKPRFKR